MAGGISAPNLYDSKEFPFKIKYDPIWSKHLPEILGKKSNKKTRKDESNKIFIRL